MTDTKKEEPFTVGPDPLITDSVGKDTGASLNSSLPEPGQMSNLHASEGEQRRCPTCGSVNQERIAALWLCQACGTEWNEPVPAPGFDCPKCGHRHQWQGSAFICVGCPCEVVGLTAPTPANVIVRVKPRFVDIETDLLPASEPPTTPLTGNVWNRDMLTLAHMKDEEHTVLCGWKGSFVQVDDWANVQCPKCLALKPPLAACLDCGLPYEKFPLDVILARSQWLDIHPAENGLLCAACIVARAAKVRGVTCVHAILEIAPHSPGVDDQPSARAAPASSAAVVSPRSSTPAESSDHNVEPPTTREPEQASVVGTIADSLTKPAVMRMHHGNGTQALAYPAVEMNAYLADLQTALDASRKALAMKDGAVEMTRASESSRRERCLWDRVDANGIAQTACGAFIRFHSLHKYCSNCGKLWCLKE